MRSLEQLDKWIAGKVRTWSSRAAGAPHSRELLEIRRDILEDVRDHIEPAGEGRNVFPYDNISVRVAGDNAHRAELLGAAFAQDDRLEHEIRELLAEAGCAPPAGFSVTVAAIDDAVLAWTDHPYDVHYARRGVRSAPSAARPNAKLTVVVGEADPAEFAITGTRVNLGRMKEVMGDKDGLRRRNDIAFSESETTVSREHAYIRYDAASGRFRLYDSGSQRGTSIFRDGRRIDVPKGAAQGVQLHSGDEINVGSARLRFETSEP